MRRRISHRLRVAAMIAYAAACAIPLSMLARSVGYAQSAPYKRLLPAWQMASGLILALGVVALSGSLACMVTAWRYNVRLPRRAIAAAWLAIVGTVVSAPVVRWIDSVKDALFYSPARTSICLSNEKRICLAMSMYSQDYDSVYPLADSWNQATEPYIENAWTYSCPEVISRAPIPSYGLLNLLAASPASRVASPASTVLLFDSRPGPNVSGGLECLANPPRHKSVSPGGSTGVNIGFVDGHAKFTPLKEVPTLVWKPAHTASPSPPDAKRTGR